jgi:hypothetical protein
VFLAQQLLAQQQPIVFPESPFVPVAVGFFGLGTGYLIYGPQELFGMPQRDASVDRATGMWGIWMPGFLQFITGVYLWVGLTWFKVFAADPLLYMAALAFTAYGVHWFVIGSNRYIQADPRPNGFMAIAFLLISILGAIVFFDGGVWPVGLLFVGLTGVYASDIFASFGSRVGERALGLFHVLTGLWLMYLTYAAALNFSLGWDLPV